MQTEFLNGIWDFYFTEEPIEKVDPARIGYTDTVSVPCCFDTLSEYAYRRGTGVYRRKVCCGGTVKLRVGALGLRGKIFWDGRKIADYEHPFTPEYFVFDAGKNAEHELVIAAENLIHEENSSTFHEDYDYYGFGGIYREVSFEILPDFYIDRIQVTPLSHETGEVRIKTFCSGRIPADYSLFVRFDTESTPAEIPVSGTVSEITRKVPAFRVWSPEKPDMHSVQISLSNGYTAQTSFGIRTLSWDGSFRINGEAVRLIGYCRHDSHPEFGYSIPQNLMASDLHMIKQQGCNFIRGSHYPQSEKFLDLCDRMGILVWDEATAWGNTEAQLKDPTFCRLQNEMTRLMVRESANHPSVVMWGFLNEASTNCRAGYDLCASLRRTILEEDTSRPVTYASCQGVKDICLEFADIVSFNAYPAWYSAMNERRPFGEVKKTLRELVDFADSHGAARKPFIISEIGASAIIGDRSGERWSEDYQSDLLAEMMDFVLNTPRVTGVAIWQFCNIRTYTGTPGFLTRPRGFNNKGVVDEFRRPKMSWFTIRDIIRSWKKEHSKF